MNIALKPIALAMLVATAQLAGVAYAEAANMPAAKAATNAPASTKSPEEWVDETGNTHSAALGQRSGAAESWAHKQYGEADNELKTAARGLESGAAWAGGEAKAGASATVADTRDLGDKLASGAAWTRDEVVRGFESLRQGINSLDQKIGSNKKASSLNAGA